MKGSIMNWITTNDHYHGIYHKEDSNLSNNPSSITAKYRRMRDAMHKKIMNQPQEIVLKIIEHEFDKYDKILKEEDPIKYKLFYQDKLFGDFQYDCQVHKENSLLIASYLLFLHQFYQENKVLQNLLKEYEQSRTDSDSQISGYTTPESQIGNPTTSESQIDDTTTSDSKMGETATSESQIGDSQKTTKTEEISSKRLSKINIHKRPTKNLLTLEEIGLLFKIMIKQGYINDMSNSFYGDIGFLLTGSNSETIRKSMNEDQYDKLTTTYRNKPSTRHLDKIITFLNTLMGNIKEIKSTKD
jgi:hypothetical protein